MSPRPDVSAERRDQILDAAAAVFARLGVYNARMDDIVAAFYAATALLLLLLLLGRPIG